MHHISTLLTEAFMLSATLLPSSKYSSDKVGSLACSW